MSYVIAAPEMLVAAAADSVTMEASLGMAHLAAAAPTVGLVPAAADEVSAGIAQLFSQFAREYQTLAAQAAEFHERFIQNLTASARAFAGAEAANTSTLGSLGSLLASAGSHAGAAGGAQTQAPSALSSPLPVNVDLGQGLLLFFLLVPFELPLILLYLFLTGQVSIFGIAI